MSKSSFIDRHGAEILSLQILIEEHNRTDLYPIFNRVMTTLANIVSPSTTAIISATKREINGIRADATNDAAITVLRTIRMIVEHKLAFTGSPDDIDWRLATRACTKCGIDIRETTSRCSNITCPELFGIKCKKGCGGDAHVGGCVIDIL